MPFVYIEFRSRHEDTDVGVYRTVFGRKSQRWAGSASPDQRLFSLARTWRIGPTPEYLTVYYATDAGLERLAEWNEIWQREDHELKLILALNALAGKIDDAGCYEPLLEPVAGSGGPYYTEFLDLHSGCGRDDLRQFFTERAARHERFVLNLLVDRIGKLGPDPRALAIWSLSDLRALREIAQELDGAAGPARLVRAGLYEDLGQEIV